MSASAVAPTSTKVPNRFSHRFSRSSRSRRCLRPSSSFMVHPPPVSFTSVPGIRGLVALRPVPVLAGKVRPRLAGEIRGYIVSLLIGQRLALSPRHLSLDERGRGVQACHPLPDVQRVRAPERWKDGLAVRARDPLPVGAVARRAL